MKVKTSELSGAALDWAVAKCEGFVDFDYGGKCFYDDEGIPFEPSCIWAQGGPIIEREGISVYLENGDWYAKVQSRPVTYYDYSPLVAAMRCYVASKLGDEIEIPERLREFVK